MLFLAAPNIYWPLFIFFLIMSVVFPIITMLLLLKNKVITTISIPKRKERIPVLIFVLIYYSMTYYIFRFWNLTLLNLLEPFLSFLFAGLLLLVVLILITLKWKISIHSASISALCGGMIAETTIAEPVISFNQTFIINTIILVLVGMVSFSRMYLNAHNFFQIIAGITIGFFLFFGVVVFQLHI